MTDKNPVVAILEFDVKGRKKSIVNGAKKSSKIHLSIPSILWYTDSEKREN